MNERRKEYRLNYTHVNLFRAVPSYTRNERTRAVKEKEKGKYKKLLIQHTHNTLANNFVRKSYTAHKKKKTTFMLLIKRVAVFATLKRIDLQGFFYGSSVRDRQIVI